MRKESHFSDTPTPDHLHPRLIHDNLADLLIVLAVILGAGLLSYGAFVLIAHCILL